MSLRAKCAIAGLGQTRMGKNFDHTGPVGFAVEAVNLALDDAGLQRADVDGLLVNPGITWMNNPMASSTLQHAMGLGDLRLTATMNLGGATAAAMIMHAAQAIDAGMAEVVACVFADAPLRPPSPNKGNHGGSAAFYGFAQGLDAHYGLFGVNAHYAFVAQRHMYRYGTTNDHLGAVAVSERKWANLNPAAQFHDTPMSMADYHASRWVVEPFHLYDCCLVSNGGLAVIVTSAARAKNLKRPPVYILGMGQGHPGRDPLKTLVSGAPIAKETAFKMAGIKAADVDFCELYDCYTFKCSSRSRITAFARKARAARSLRVALSAPAVRSRSIPAAVSSVPFTCGDDSGRRGNRADTWRWWAAAGGQTRRWTHFRQRRYPSYSFHPRIGIADIRLAAKRAVIACGVM